MSSQVADARFGSMETGQSLCRAMLAAAAMGVDVINLSYGETVNVPNRGRIVDLATSLTRAHGIVFVSSAGNCWERNFDSRFAHQN